MCTTKLAELIFLLKIAVNRHISITYFQCFDWYIQGNYEIMKL